MIAKNRQQYRRKASEIEVSPREIEAVVSGFGCYRIWYTKDANYVSFDKWSGKFELRDGRNRVLSLHRTIEAAIAAAPLTHSPQEIKEMRDAV